MSDLNLYKITLPVETNDRHSTEDQQKTFEAYVGDTVGGFTKFPVAQGFWFDREQDPPKQYRERVVQYEIICGPMIWPAIVLKAFDLFNDQEAIAWSWSGYGTIQRRPTAVAQGINHREVA